MTHDLHFWGNNLPLRSWLLKFQSWWQSYNSVIALDSLWWSNGLYPTLLSLFRPPLPPLNLWEKRLKSNSVFFPLRNFRELRRSPSSLFSVLLLLHIMLFPSLPPRNWFMLLILRYRAVFCEPMWSYNQSVLLPSLVTPVSLRHSVERGEFR